MIQSPPAVGGAPVAGPIAPPGVELFFQGYARTHGINQAATGKERLELVCLYRGVTHNGEKRPVGPHIVFMRCHVEVAEDHRRLLPMVAGLAKPLGKLIEELKLVSEFLVDLGIR